MRDYRIEDTVRIMYSTNDSTGAAVTQTGVTVSVYDEASTTQTTTGVTTTTDFDAVTGMHLVSIVLATMGALPGHTYSVMLQATVATKSVVACIGQFSVLNQGGDIVSRGLLSAGGAGAFTLPSGQRANVKVGDAIRLVGGSTGKGYRFILTYNSGTGVGTVSAWDTNAAASDPYEVVSVPNSEPLAAADFATGAITATTLAAATITAAKFATDAIDANAIRADAVTEIQTGLATSAAQTTMQGNVTTLLADTANIKTRLPAALVSGKMDSTATATVDNAAIQAAVFAHAVETGLTFDAFCKLVGAVLLGKTTQLEATGTTFSSADISGTLVNGAKTRITATRESDSDRTALVVDIT